MSQTDSVPLRRAYLSTAHGLQSSPIEQQDLLYHTQFWRIFNSIDHFRKSVFANLVDNTSGISGKLARHSYADIVESLIAFVMQEGWDSGREEIFRAGFSVCGAVESKALRVFIVATYFFTITKSGMAFKALWQTFENRLSGLEIRCFNPSSTIKYLQKYSCFSRLTKLLKVKKNIYISR